jgi:acyl-CoA thioesterase-1
VLTDDGQHKRKRGGYLNDVRMQYQKMMTSMHKATANACCRGMDIRVNLARPLRMTGSAVSPAFGPFGRRTGACLQRAIRLNDRARIRTAATRLAAGPQGRITVARRIPTPIQLAFATVSLLSLVVGPASVVRAADSAGNSLYGHKTPERIVFLGDSITDGNSYPLLVRQALVEADKPAPVCIDAGIGGDTAAGMLKRLDRDVLSHRPTLVTLSAGINDALHGVAAADYERDVTAIAEWASKSKLRLLIINTTILGEKYADADKRLDRYNEILHDLAQTYKCPLADVNHLMHDARAGGRDVLEDDQVHPNYEGQRLIARAVLDALGDNDLPVPTRMKVELMPGVIRTWTLQPVADHAKPLDEASVAALKPGDGWTEYKLPEPGPAGHWWRDQERQRGFALALEETLGKAKSYRGIATVESKTHRFAYLNPGAALETIWVNGHRVYEHGPAYTGWHAGRERVRFELQAGTNSVVIESGQNFFLSITDDNQW